MEWSKEKEAQICAEFCPVERGDAVLFLPFQKTVVFGDTTFSLFYAWKEQFHYAYRLWRDVAVVFEYGIDGRPCCILMHDGREDTMIPIVSELYQLFQKAGLPLCFDYVCADELPLYARIADFVGRGVTIRSNSDDSDYIYQTEDFLSLTGNRNKGKRGSLNALRREYPDLHMVLHDGEHNLRPDALAVFDQWCAVHSCPDCFYGCEKTAFLRFLDIFDPDRHRLAVGYAVGEPICFAASERVNAQMECYYFQKNAVRTRGLTYWLNREMALAHPDVTYINLGEDMGLPGLRTDKTGLHPCRCEPKFTVQLL